MTEKIRPDATIDCNHNNDYYVAYKCPKCQRRIGKGAEGCVDCGISFDWSSRAIIRVTREIIWE